MEPGDCGFPIRRGIGVENEEGEVEVEEADKHRFLEARGGDHLVTMFQCALCHFRNIHLRDPGAGPMDNRLLSFIRRATMDAFWSREASTVRQTSQQLKRAIALGSEMGLEPRHILGARGPFPLEDRFQMATACVMLSRSLAEGRNEAWIQFGTIRQVRSAVHNQWRSTPAGLKPSIAVRGQTKLMISGSPTNGEWFERFVEGLHRRMGDLSLPDRAVSIEVMLELLRKFEERWWRAKDEGSDAAPVLFPALFAICSFVGGLRGEEVPLADLGTIREHYDEGISHPRYPHVTLALRGRFKSETGEICHLKPLAITTASGIQVKVWFDRMIEWYSERGITRGHVFRRPDGGRGRMRDFEGPIFEVLEEIRDDPHLSLIGSDVEICEVYGLGRSFRRGSTGQAKAQGLSDEIISLNNRWKTVENARGRQAAFSMVMHYTDVRQVLSQLIRYSKAL